MVERATEALEALGSALKRIGDWLGGTATVEAVGGVDVETGRQLSGGERVVAGTEALATFTAPVGTAVDISLGRAALRQLMAGEYKVMFGAGTTKIFRAAEGLGGEAADWAYVTSRVVWEHRGLKWQAHWALNVRTGETAMAKLKAVGFVR